MAIPGSLGNELFKYRRRRKRPLDGSVPGLPQERFHKSRRYISGMPYVPRQGGHDQDLYNWGLPREYHPSLNAPAAQSDEYTDDPDWESHHILHSHQEKLLRPFPELEPTESPFDYEHARAMSDFFLHAMDVQYQPFEEGQEVPSMADIWQAHVSGDLNSRSELMRDIGGTEDLPDEFASQGLSPQGLPDLESMTDTLSQLRQVFPEDHPDILRLEAAIQMVRYHGVTPDASEPEMGPSYAPMEQAAGGYEQDLFGQQEAAFEQQVHALEEMVDGYGGDTMPNMQTRFQPDMGLEAMVEEHVGGYAEFGGLEQMVEQEEFFEAMPSELMAEAMPPDVPEMGMPDPFAAAEGLGSMTPEDEIDQAIDALAGQPGPQEMELEPDPFQMQHDPFATAQQIFDQQMQFMANPFMMPGMMPMGPAPGM